MMGHRQVEQAALLYEFSLDKLSFPKIPSDLNWRDEVESLHRRGILYALGMFIVDLFKSRSRLEAENLLLRRDRRPTRLLWLY